jgi:hypothetical protein
MCDYALVLRFYFPYNHSTPKSSSPLNNKDAMNTGHLFCNHMPGCSVVQLLRGMSNLFNLKLDNKQKRI